MNNLRYTVDMPRDKGVKYDSFRYPGGEVQVRLKADQLELIKQSDQLIVTAHINNGDIMELASMTSAINGVKPEGFHLSHLVLPYLPYARADRRFTPGDAAGLETFMKLVKQLGYKYIWSFDVHSPAAKALGVMNIYPERFIQRAVNDIGRSSLAILLPDKGAVRYDIEHLDLPVYQASKVREPVTVRKSQDWKQISAHLSIVDGKLETIALTSNNNFMGSYLALGTDTDTVVSELRKLADWIEREAK